MYFAFRSGQCSCLTTMSRGQAYNNDWIIGMFPVDYEVAFDELNSFMAS